MTIKDVEKLTGLTAKSIRYYESKGLITVERNEDNSYRSYSENEVNRLKQIKLFRYLDFSIEEIGKLLDEDEEQVKEALRNKAEMFAEQKDACENKEEICLNLAKDYKMNPQLIEEYNDAIEFMESDEMAELIEDLKNYSCPNLWVTIMQTLIFSGPILWLFYNIHIERVDALVVNAVCALLGTAFITGNWIHYVSQYRRNRNRVKKNNRKWAWNIPIVIITFIVGLGALVGFMMFAEMLMAPDNYIFYERHAIADVVLIWSIIIPVILVCGLVVTKISKKNIKELEDVNDIVYIWNHLGKFRPVMIGIWIVVMYCCITSVTFVTEDTIVCCSPVTPKGIEYEYSDIEEINTGFGDKSFAVAEYKKKGNFYYQIKLDGKMYTFHVPSVNEEIERYAEDTYLELEDFDKALVGLGIPKNADDENYENCDLDKQYVERFLRIINLR